MSECPAGHKTEYILSIQLNHIRSLRPNMRNTFRFAGRTSAKIDDLRALVIEEFLLRQQACGWNMPWSFCVCVWVIFFLLNSRGGILVANVLFHPPTTLCLKWTASPHTRGKCSRTHCHGGRVGIAQWLGSLMSCVVVRKQMWFGRTRFPTSGIAATKWFTN